MAVMEAQQWCDKPENHEELARDLAKRQWINAPVEDIIDRTKGKFDYGIPGKVVENSPHIMKYWKDFASYPFQSHDLWFLTEDIRWGKFEPSVDTKALIKKVNREDIWRDGREGAERSGRPDPGLDLARQGDLLRRQGLRSGKSDRLPQEPGDQARRDRLSRACARRIGATGTAMNMPLKKSETAIALPAARRGREGAAARRAAAPAADGPLARARIRGRGERHSAARRDRADPAGVGAAVLAGPARRCRRPRAC